MSLRETSDPNRKGLPPAEPLPAAGARPPEVGIGKPVAWVIVGAGLALVVGFVWIMLVGSYDQFAAALIAGSLLVLTAPIARHAARVEAWPALSWLLMIAMALRLGGALARYVVAYGVYGGVADASTYTTVASGNYKAFRHLHVFWPDTSVFHGLVPWLDTVVYGIFGPTELGSFFVFAWINFVGTYLFYRAFRIAYPEGDGHRYAMLVFFLPSLIYWPSSLGKEGWMVFAIGLACYGLARSLVGRVGGYFCLMLGIGAMLLVRPHLALIFLPAAVIAFLLRRSQPGRKRPVGRLVGIGVLLVSSLVVVAKAQSYFGITNLDVQSITQQLNTTRVQTAIGNSAFRPPNAQSPLGFPEAVVTVLFRPFPFEAHSLAVALASLEGLVLLALTAVSWRRLRSLPAALWRSPYVVFALLYSALFVLAFANFSNFGILARERVQMLPLFMVLLSIPGAPREAVEATVAKGRVDRRPSSSPAPMLRSYRPSTSRRRAVSHARGSAAGTYQALGFRFDLFTAGEDAQSLGEHFEWALSGLRATPPAEHRYRLTTMRGSGGLVRIERDGRRLGPPRHVALAVVDLVADLNQMAIASRPDRLVLHAAAVSFDGRGVLLPGRSGSGKTMLSAALVAAGFGYITDEAAAVDLASLMIEPYPKPLSLEPGSLAILGFPVPDQFDVASAEMVPASFLRSGAEALQVPARILVFPRYEEGAVTTLTPMKRSKALVEVANNSFNFVDHGGAWLDGLSSLVSGCWCGTLVSGDIDRAVELLIGLVNNEKLPSEVSN